MEQPDYVPVLVALISAAAGIITTLFTVSLNSRQQKRRDQEQQDKEERDRASAALAAAQQLAEKNREQGDAFRRKMRFYKNEYDYLRAWILAQQLTTQQLKDLPPPPDYR